MKENEFIVDMENNDKTNQLSVKGLCLLMAIFAEKEQSDNQPVIAGSIASLIHLVKLIDNSALGTELTVIFNPSDGNPDLWLQTLGMKQYDSNFSSFHKTTLTLRKSNDGVFEVKHIDSVSSNQHFIDIPNKLILKALKENAENNQRPATLMFSLEPDFPDNPDSNERVFDGRKYKTLIKKFPRQRDNFSCGTYAIKDARLEIHARYPTEFVEVPEIEDQDKQAQGYQCRKFIISPSIMRSTQDRNTRNYLINNSSISQSVVNKKGETLKKFLDRYEAGAYIIKISNKYLGLVTKCYHNKSPDEINKMVKCFNGESFTDADILRINKARIAQLDRKKNENVVASGNSVRISKM